MIIDWNKFYREKLIEAAMEMAIAARTAPKGRGRDLLHILVLTEGDKDLLADRMDEFGRLEGMGFVARDAANLRQAAVILLLGTASEPLLIARCGNCGFRDCDENRAHETTPCAFAVTDLGIAVGSAAALASARHIDNRVWFSAGQVARVSGLFPPEVVLAYGIPLAATGKNIFFDRTN